MSAPFLAEIRIFAGNFAPRGWALCSGQIMPISQNTALFSLLGTTYGGDGKSTFGLPNLQGCAPVHAGQGPGLTDRSLGEVGGSPTVTLLTTEVPQHTHTYTAGSGSRGNVAAINTCISTWSGYSAIGASIWSSSACEYVTACGWLSAACASAAVGGCCAWATPGSASSPGDTSRNGNA